MNRYKTEWITNYDRQRGYGDKDLTQDRIEDLQIDYIFGKIDASQVGDRNLSYLSEVHSEQIYKDIFGDVTVKRFRNKEESILDIKFHIDTILTLPNHSQISGQEKFLRNHFSSFDTFTVEFYQNRFEKTPGEYFHISSQFFLHGYWNREYTGFEKWYVVDLLQFFNWLGNTYSFEQIESMTRASTGRASFFYIRYRELPDFCIYDSFNQKIKLAL